MLCGFYAYVVEDHHFNLLDICACFEIDVGIIGVDNRQINGIKSYVIN